MKLDELFESAEKQPFPDEISQTLIELTMDLEDLYHVDFSFKEEQDQFSQYKHGKYSIDRLEVDSKGLQSITIWTKESTISIEIHANLNWNGKSEMHAKTVEILERYKLRTAMNGTWNGKNGNITTYEGTLGYLPEAEKKPAPTGARTGQAPKYDPQQARQDRMTPAARSRQGRISQASNRDSFGGDSSNYRS
jgi:hypothetical protein